ncbi:MAG: M67 family metallopeptidase [Propionibacteriaceae bacterium]|jgi:proteasome lid subunit RPN8/RPN11|nr:M67 family metallopeptidase [Propionibacteriaceae bacterium]
MIHVPDAVAARFAAEGERTYPAECCGVLLGRLEPGATEGCDRRYASAILPVDNARTDRAGDRFVITPEAYLKAEAAADAQGLELLGFYHSHPDDQARPSDYDRDHAWPNLSYIVMAVQGQGDGTGRTTGWASWELAADRSAFRPEPLIEGGLHG